MSDKKRIINMKTPGLEDERWAAKYALEHKMYADCERCEHLLRTILDITERELFHQISISDKVKRLGASGRSKQD